MIRVVELATSVAGPFSGQILGDLGADVIKVEPPDRGDDTRHWGPPFWEGESCTFLSLNRNKRSVEIDLKSESGRKLFHGLLATADVFLHNLRPAAIDRLGLGSVELMARYPELIYCAIGGYGSGGSWSNVAAYDPLVQAFSGLMSITGEPGGDPVRIPVSILDQGSAMWAVIGVLQALRQREESGRGALVETSLLSTALMWMPAQIAGYLATGELPQRLGSGTAGVCPYGAFATADGHLLVAAGNQAHWHSLCQALERDDLRSDPRFESNADRVAHRDELEAALTRVFAGRTTDEWQEILNRRGVPSSAIQNVGEAMEHAQVQAAGGIIHANHPAIPDLRVVRLPVDLNATTFRVRRPPPRLGEHTKEIMTEISAARSREAG